MTNMTAEQIIEKIQEIELTAWNDWRRSVETYGNSAYTHSLECKHKVINDLMEELEITITDEVVRIPLH